MTNTEKTVEDLKAKAAGVNIDSDALGKHLNKCMGDYFRDQGIEGSLVNPGDIAEAVTKLNVFTLSALAQTMIDQVETEQVREAVDGFLCDAREAYEMGFAMIAMRAILAAEMKIQGKK